MWLASAVALGRVRLGHHELAITPVVRFGLDLAPDDLLGLGHRLLGEDVGPALTSQLVDHACGFEAHTASMAFVRDPRTIGSDELSPALLDDGEHVVKNTSGGKRAMLCPAEAGRHGDARLTWLWKSKPP